MESWCEVKTQGVTDICKFIGVIMMLLTTGFWQECCEIPQAWCCLGPRRKHTLRACLLFRPISLGLHFTSALNTWSVRAGHCILGGVSLITAFSLVHAWDLSCLGTGRSWEQMAPFHDLSQLTRDSNLAWKAWLPEGPGATAGIKLIKTTTEQFVKMSRPAQTHWPS